MSQKPKKKKISNTPIPLIPGLKTTDQNHTQESEILPFGKLRMIVTFLEMTSPPRRPRSLKRFENTSILRAHHPSVKFYRFLYDAVGEKWMWFERKSLDDEQLKRIIKNPKVHIYVLYVDGNPAGYSELDYRRRNFVKLAYFGLTPEYMGKGLGKYFLNWTLDKAWISNPKRVWVHTCNFDSPFAIATYQKAGFNVYKQEEEIIDDPRV